MVNDGFLRATWIGLMVFLFLVASLGCASTPGKSDPHDPLERTNRAVYRFNEALDKAVLKPAADAYVKITPQPVRTSVSNFFDNLAYPNVILNDLLQGKMEQSVSDTSRFIWNSTVGIFGLFDVASYMGMAPHDEDFGQTLGVWGSGAGPYLVLPLLGPSTVRDTTGLPITYVTNALFYVGQASVTYPLAVLNAIDLRARAAGFMRFLDVAALDPYLFTRESYLQYRTYLIYDGRVPRAKLLEEEEGEEDEGVPEKGQGGNGHVPPEEKKGDEGVPEKGQEGDVAQPTPQSWDETTHAAPN